MKPNRIFIFGCAVISLLFLGAYIFGDVCNRPQNNPNCERASK